MSVERPSRSKNSGLVFSSRKRQRSPSPVSTSPKRLHTSSESALTLSHPSTSTNTKIITRILVISDTHGISSLPQPILQSQSIDIVLHCGDLSEYGTLEEYENTIQLLESIPAPLKLVIPGNHDLTLDRKFWVSNSTEEGAKLYEEARALWDSVKNSGIQLLEEGKHTFVLDNGGLFKIYANPYTVNNQRVREWAFGYESGEDRYNSKEEAICYGTVVGTEESVLRSEEDLDVVMTHGPPKYRLDLSSQNESLGCPHLFRAMRRIRPKLHVFGHVHNAYGAEEVQWQQVKEMPDDDDFDDGIREKRVIGGTIKERMRWIEAGKGDEGLETIFVNAALMGRDEKLENAPWLVNVELKAAESNT